MRLSCFDRLILPKRSCCHCEWRGRCGSARSADDGADSRPSVGTPTASLCGYGGCRTPCNPLLAWWRRHGKVAQPAGLPVTLHLFLSADVLPYPVVNERRPGTSGLHLKSDEAASSERTSSGEDNESRTIGRSAGQLVILPFIRGLWTGRTDPLVTDAPVKFEN